MTDKQALAETYNAKLTEIDELESELNEAAKSLGRIANWLQYHRDEIAFNDDGTQKRFQLTRDYGRVKSVSFDDRALGDLAKQFVQLRKAIRRRIEIEQQLITAGLDRLIRQKS